MMPCEMCDEIDPHGELEPCAGCGVLVCGDCNLGHGTGADWCLSCQQEADDQEDQL